MQINIFPNQQNVTGCPECEIIISEERQCRCGKDTSSEEEEGSESSKKFKYCDAEVQTFDSCSSQSEESFQEECSQEQESSQEESSRKESSQEESSQEECSQECSQDSSQEEEFCSREVQTSRTNINSESCPESSEESPKPSSEECSKPDDASSSHSSEESCKSFNECCKCSRNKKYASSEEIQTQTSEEYVFRTPTICEGSSEELPTECEESSEESREEHPTKCEESSEEQPTKCEESSEEQPTKCEESSEEEPTKFGVESSNCGQDDSEEYYDEEHWCKGRPIKTYTKRCRYSNPNNCPKRFSRYRRELFLDDLEDGSAYTEPLTRNEIQKTIGKLRANKTITKRRRKHKRRQHLVQNKDQFEEHNKLKLILEDKPSEGDLEQKLEDEMFSKQNEGRNKRHSQCRTIERLKKHPKYKMSVLADAGCSQYIPEIITDRNKRHLPQLIKQHPFKNDPRFYYKYLSLTAPDLSPDYPNAKNEDSGKKRIVFDHLGHKFLEFNGFRTLIKPKIEYIEDASSEKPKFWTCKEDLINPEDFGKITTVPEDVGTTPDASGTTEQPTPKDTPQVEDSPKIEDPPQVEDHQTEDPPQADPPKADPPQTEDPPQADPPQTDPPQAEVPQIEEHEQNLQEYLKNLTSTDNSNLKQEARNTFVRNCESYVKFLIFNPSNDGPNITDSTTKYLENLLDNSHVKTHIRKLFHAKHKLENNLANVAQLLHKPKVVENFKNYLLFQNEFDAMKRQLGLTDYTILQFYSDVLFVLNEKHSI